MLVHRNNFTSQRMSSRALVSVYLCYYINSSVLPDSFRNREMVGELQLMLNTCLCTHISKRRAVIRFSTGSTLDKCLPALNWLAYEESFRDALLERNRAGFSYINITVNTSQCGARSGHSSYQKYPIFKNVLDERKKNWVVLCRHEGSHK